MDPESAALFGYGAGGYNSLGASLLQNAESKSLGWVQWRERPNLRGWCS
jgi:hypothetical protein